MSRDGQAPFLRRHALATSAAVLAAALVTWVVTVQRMRGMDAGPGTDLGSLGWYVGVWVTMMAAMMLPSALPMVLLFHRMSHERTRRWNRLGSTWLFVASYLAIWTLYGLAAFGVYRAIAALHIRFLAWDHSGPYVAGTVIALAGVYELTPLKAVCLRHCRSPLHYVLGGWKNGRLGAVRMGVTHGSYCLGCCWGLMLLLFALGVMSLFWMALVAALIFAQKLLPFGQRLPYAFALVFTALGVWVAAAPGSVPQLTQPNSPARMQMNNMRPSMQTPHGTPVDQMQP
jgi:predicted metal-binding membrane protein